MALPEDVRIAKALDDGDSDDEDIPVHDAPIDDVDQEFENEVARAMSPNSGGVEMSTLSQPAPPQLTGIVIEPSAPHQEDNRPDLSGSVPGIVPPGSLSPLPLRRGVSAPKSPKPMDPLLAQVIKEDYPPENVLSWTPEQKQHLIEVTTIETVPLLLIKARRAGWMSQATTVSFRNLFYRKKGSILVNGVSGYIKSGTMVAVIGQGATSLFELLCGRQKGGRMQGEILFNGSPPCDDLKNIVAMIPKDDVHLPTLTVRETIEFSSRLRVSPSFPRELAMMRNELIIKLLGLKHCAETVVGDGTLRGISGGEKRRLSVAVELVADHSVIVSDLPTNGLDSASAMRLVMMCKHSCKADYSHLMSVAQPSPQLLAQFDSVMLLSRGTCIYQGPPDRAEAYFASLNFVRPKLKNLPDFLEELCHTPGKFFVARNAYDLMGVASPQMQIAGGPDDAMAARPSVVDAQQNGVEDKNEMKGQDATALVPCHCWKKLTRAYKESKMYSDVGQTLWTELEPIYDIEPQNKPVVEEFRTSALTQLALCTIRQWKITVRNKANTFGGIGRAIFMGLLLGTLFYQLSSAQVAARARMGVLFSAIVFAGMTPIQSVAGFLQQRAVFYSQQAAGYFRGVTFFLGHLMASMPLLWLEMFIFSILLYGIAGLADNVGSARFWFFFLTMALTTMTSRSLCLLIASGSPSTHVATSVAPVAVVMCILFNGFLVSKDSIPDGWIWMYYLSFMTYGLRGIAINEYFSLDFSCRPEELVPPTSAPNYSVPPPSGYGFLQPDMGVCPFNSGHRMLERYGMDTSVEGDKWLLWVYLVIFWFGFTTLNAMILLWLDWSGQETVLSHGQDDAEEGMKKKSAHPEASTVKGDGRKKASASYVEFDNLTYTVSVKTKRRRSPPFCWKKVKAPKKLLNGVYGYAVPGKMIALMGASGAGKSTLLDVLANRKTEGEVGGKLLFNGKQRDRYFSRWAGYVEQFDSHFETSTVREAIQFSADLRLPQTISPEEKAKRVQKVMDQLELNSVADQRIGSTEHGGISPALRKKVTIAVELIMDPGMLFLDEPTTGLDSAAAMEVMTATRKLADEISVICTIHQPSEELVRLFDWLLLLQPGGSVVYFGPVAEVGSYFKKIGLGEPYPGQNIAEFALQAIGNRTADRQKEPEKYADPANLFLESAEGQAVKQKLAHGIDKELDREPASFNFDSVYATGFLWQFILLLRRFVQMQIREPAVVGTRVFVSFAVAFTVGTLYFQTGYDQPGINNRVSFFFLGLMFINFAATAVLNKVIEQRAAYFRENTSNMYSWFVFWFARFIADIPAVVIQVVLFTVISSYLAGMKDGAEFGNFFAIMLIGNLSAYAFSEACGIVGHDAEFANAINTFLLTAMMFFTGFLIQKDGIPNAWMFLYYINVFRYPLFFMIGNELHDETFGCPNNAGSVYVPVNSTYCSSQSLNDRNCFIPTCPFTDGQQMLKQFSVDSTELSELFGITVVIFVGLRIISAILFRTVNHIKR